MADIVQTRGLCKQYGKVLRVNHLDLQVPEGAIYGFLGPNGAGKSTTLKMILGLVRPTAGSISVFGKEVNGHNRLDMLKQVGSLIESPSYYGHLTGEENLKVVQTLRGVPEKDVYEVLEIVRLEGQRSKKVAHYSLGMKQRLGLAAALLGFPRLLILDEPTNGLDPAGIKQVRDLLKRMREEYEMTVMVSSHILGEMEAMADTVGIIHRGRMREEISLRELEGRGTSYLHLTVDDPGRASVLLSDVMHLGSFRVMKGGIIRIYDRQASPQEVAGVLARHHVAVEEIGRRSETLEEHFLKLTSEEGSTWES